MSGDAVAGVVGALSLPLCLASAGLLAESRRHLALRIMAVGFGLPLLWLVAALTAGVGARIGGGTIVGAVIGAVLVMLALGFLRGVWQGRSWAMLIVLLYSVAGIILSWRQLDTNPEAPLVGLRGIFSWPFALWLAGLQLRDVWRAAQARVAEGRAVPRPSHGATPTPSVQANFTSRRMIEK
jgi:uncharacterized membrane protein